MRLARIRRDTTMSEIQKQTEAAGSQDALDMRHGVNCSKVKHETWHYYMHASDDDTPYNVDGVSYCGRCHHVMPHIAQGSATREEPR